MPPLLEKWGGNRPPCPPCSYPSVEHCDLVELKENVAYGPIAVHDNYRGDSKDSA